MAYARTRSVNRELEAGATDGKYRKVIADRGGDVERSFVANRTDLTGAFYGIHEAPVMEMPGCDRACTNPYAVSTPAPDPEYF
jgi:hypothetical protein